MHPAEQYRQAAFDLTLPQPPTPEGPDLPAVSPIDRDPAVLPNGRLRDDFWAEFHLEWAFRETHGMVPVSPAEFADMRDRADGLPDDPRREHTVFDARRERLDAALALLARGIEGITTSEGFRRYLSAMAKFHPYSANNVAMILAQRSDATRVMGFGNKAGTTGWKSLGRYVRKGETGITIIRPMHRTIPDPETEEPRKVLTGFTTATVFDVSQTEGKPLPQGPRPETLTEDEQGRSLELRVALMRVIDDRQVRVVRDRETTKNGWWHPGRREIGIRADLAGVRELKTLAHEAAHMLADHRREAVDAQDAETVAESVAFVLLDHHGIDTSAYSVPYIAGWARSPQVFQRNLDTVRTLSHTLLVAMGDQCPPEDAEGGSQ